MKIKNSCALAACMALALTAPVSANPTSSLHHTASHDSASASPVEVAVLTTATLETVTGAINWRKVACWSGVVALAVGASVAGSPGIGAVASAALAIGCLAT